MNSDTGNLRSRLNSRLRESGQWLAAIDPRLARWRQRAAGCSGQQVAELTVIVYYLTVAIEEVDEILADKVLGLPVQDVAPETLKRYRCDVAPRRQEFIDLLHELLELQFEDDFIATTPVHPYAVLSVLDAGLQHWLMDNDADQVFSDLELGRAKQLVDSEFFRPDEWLRNAEQLDPVSGRDFEQRLPSPIRIRLKEIYRSYILGNHLATLSLARATLEYCIHDRAGGLGIEPGSNNNAAVTEKRLGRLVDEVGEQYPDLVPAMRNVVECGNKVLHPRRKMEKVTLHPDVVRRDALRVVHDLREIIEALFAG